MSRARKTNYEQNPEKRCAKCGKLFISAPYHVFKKNGKWYCTWTCYNHRNERSGAENEQSDQKRD